MCTSYGVNHVLVSTRRFRNDNLDGPWELSFAKSNQSFSMPEMAITTSIIPALNCFKKNYSSINSSSDSRAAVWKSEFPLPPKLRIK